MSDFLNFGNGLHRLLVKLSRVLDRLVAPFFEFERRIARELFSVRLSVCLFSDLKYEKSKIIEEIWDYLNVFCRLIIIFSSSFMADLLTDSIFIIFIRNLVHLTFLGLTFFVLPMLLYVPHMDFCSCHLFIINS